MTQCRREFDITIDLFLTACALFSRSMVHTDDFKFGNFLWD